MFDSLLYGNGLTLELFNKIRKLNNVFLIKSEYLSSNIFIEEFICFSEHKRLRRNFEKLFEITPEVLKKHEEVRKYIYQNICNIKQFEFEKWVAKSLFTKNQSHPKLVISYIYFLYNYWFQVIYENILNLEDVRKEICNIGTSILSTLNNKTNIYTLNFDIVFDEYLNPKHIHGRFVNPLLKISDIILFCEGNDVEYKYLFGGNGFEKWNRLNKINKINTGGYDLEFIYKPPNHFGYLLIYGISFGKSEIYPDGLEAYPKHKDFSMVQYLDGHILFGLNQYFKDNRVNKITIAYHTNDDLENYKEIFNNLEMKKIVDFKPTCEIFNFL